MSTLTIAALLFGSALASAGNDQISGGIPSLNPNGMLVIGGITGGNTTDPGARNCYGSTLCRESGSYYTQDGILNYKNGDPLVQRGTTKHIGTDQPANVSNNINHTQWCSNHYRSYRASDNSYQPFAGTRKTCSSPFQ